MVPFRYKINEYYCSTTTGDFELGQLAFLYIIQYIELISKNIAKYENIIIMFSIYCQYLAKNTIIPPTF